MLCNSLFCNSPISLARLTANFEYVWLSCHIGDKPDLFKCTPVKLTAAWPNIFKPILKVLLLFNSKPVTPLMNSPILPPAFPANISG